MNEFENDDIYRIFNIYLNTRKPLVSDDDAKKLLDEYSNELNVFIRATIDYLISCSKKYYHMSHLPLVCNEIILEYYNHIEEFKKASAAHVLSRVIKWTIRKFPNQKPVISKTLFGKTINGNKNNIRFLSTIVYLINDKNASIFNNGQYFSFLQHFNKVDVSQEKCVFYYESFKTLINTILLADKSCQKECYRYLIDFTIKYLDFFDDHTKHSELQQIIDMMDLVGGYSDSDYNLVNSELEKVNAESLKRLQKIDIDVPQNIVETLRTKSEDFLKFLNQCDNGKKIITVLINLSVFKLDEIYKSIKESKSGLLGFVNENVLDKNGRLINYKKLSEKEQFSLDAREHIGFYVKACFDVMIRPFFVSVTVDANTKQFLKDIIYNCDSVKESKKDYIIDLFTLFFERNFKDSIFNIILEFEDILRNYLKSKNLYIYKKDRTRDLIGLHNIFNNYEANSFRDELLKIITEDYYFTFKWLLTDQYGFDLRDKIAHRIDSDCIHNDIYSIFSVFYILKLLMAL